MVRCYFDPVVISREYNCFHIGNYGIGGITIDAQKPGVIMAASLNKWYPDGQIWRSLNGGATWSNFYNFSYPGPDYQLAVTPHYKWVS
jgi:xyloglucan-specific exo-beta-1,4-glucanase